jgi:uncharacterized protein (TIGR02186 family)
MSPRRSIVLLLMALAWLLTGATRGVAAEDRVDMNLKTSADLIEVTLSYRGDLVKIWGTVPPGFDVVVKLASPREKAVFSRKGKFGPFWLSVGRVRFSNVPWMYKVKSNKPLDEILTPQEQVRYRLGIRGLKASIGVQKGVDRDLYLNELILIRKAGRLFSLWESGVTRQGRMFDTSFFWPSDGPAGRYFIEAFAVRNGRVVDSRKHAIVVKRVGLEAWVSRLSRSHGILYGAFAVALAIVAGLAASLIFKHPKRTLGTD